MTLRVPDTSSQDNRPVAAVIPRTDTRRLAATPGAPLIPRRRRREIRKDERARRLKRQLLSSQQEEVWGVNKEQRKERRRRKKEETKTEEEEKRRGMKEEIWGLEEDASFRPPLSLLVRGSLH